MFTILHIFSVIYMTVCMCNSYTCMKIGYYLTHLHVYNSHLYSCS